MKPRWQWTNELFIFDRITVQMVEKMADKVGYIYLATNETMPSLVKIGMTTGDVKERLKQLSAETGVPKPFVCPFFRKVNKPSEVEKHLHELFGWCRVNDKREFFETDFRNVKNALLTMGMDNATTFPDIPKEESNISDEDVNSLALIEAVKKSDNLSEVERLLDAGADPNMVNANGETALTETSLVSMTKQLLWAGAKPNIKGKNEQTALINAVRCYSDEVIKLLLNAGANVNLANNFETLLHAIVDERYDSSYIKLFLDAGANVNTTNKNGDTPLHIAIRKKNNSAIEILLDRGEDINAIGKEGNTPLHFAVKNYGMIRTVSALLNRGANADMVNHKGKTPLYIAVYDNSADDVKSLLGAKANPNICDNKYRSPLDIAQFFNHNEIADLLIEHGGMSGKDLLELKILEEEVEQTYSNPSVLMVSIKNGETAHIRRLLEAGANMRQPTDDADLYYAFHKGGYSRYIHAAASMGYVEITRLILKYSLEALDLDEMEELIEREDECGDTPLFCATSVDFDEKNHEDRMNSTETVELLIQYGADVNAQQQPDRYNDRRVSVLDMAKSYGNAETVELLKKHGAKTGAELWSRNIT